MNPDPAYDVIGMNEPHQAATALTVPLLVGQVYDAAPAADKSHILEILLRPLGMLSLLAVAGGVFAKVRFRGGWPDLQVRLEDAQNVQASDVITLVDYVQQVSFHTVDGLAKLLSATPLITSSAAAGLLVTLLLQRARGRRMDDLGTS